MVKESEMVPEEVLKSVVNLTQNAHEKLFLKSLYYTAGRISEVCGEEGITPDSIISNKNTIVMRNLKSKLYKRNCAKCGTSLKNGQNTCFCGCSDIIKTPTPKRYKDVLVPNQYILELLDYIDRHNINSDKPIFPFSRWQGYRITRRAFERAGVEKVGKEGFGHPHLFRHGFVMKGIKAGADLKFLQDQTGHASGANLFEYMHVSHEKKKKEMEKMFGSNKSEE